MWKVQLTQFMGLLYDHVDYTIPRLTICSKAFICSVSSTSGKIFSRWHFKSFFLFFSENKVWHFLQIVSSGDNLHEMTNPVFKEKKTNVISFLSAELAH